MSDDRDPERRLEELLAEHREPDPGAADPDGAAADRAAALDPFAPSPTPAAPDGRDGEAAPGESREKTGDGLPDAPLFALLRTVETEIGPERTDRIWVFPLRRLETGETAVVVISGFTESDPDRRRVYAAHYTVHEQARETRFALDEFGTAPTERVGRMVEEVVERIKDGPAGAPRSHTIDGRGDRWNEVLHELAEAHLAAVRENPRLRP